MSLNADDSKRKYYKEWYEKNKDKRKAYNVTNKEQVREWHMKNRERVLEHKRKYREKNREKELIRHKKYFEANRERLLARARLNRELQKHRAKDPSAEPPKRRRRFPRTPVVPCSTPIQMQMAYILN
ncbi:unnamed protein product [Aphanomyces euteiches]|uniref:Uncharacterized protein n=1 Tax=Aphanomyces euteiches TaxID=100861 RepID=A0A6G0WIF6_9STRA|nr:hypothetical protein Ae201684_014868 [Aphanomyces euteiches]KAH9072619.1 hypothetical protein Ae201684P_015694 [Aphanomyces euteiches]KAH9132718.1 hypothetical protein AeRB84_020983 [Aphanomyces euteiches]